MQLNPEQSLPQNKSTKGNNNNNGNHINSGCKLCGKQGHYWYKCHKYNTTLIGQTQTQFREKKEKSLKPILATSYVNYEKLNY